MPALSGLILNIIADLPYQLRLAQYYHSANKPKGDYRGQWSIKLIFLVLT